MATNKLLRKPIIRKKDETQENKKEKVNEVEDLLSANLSKPNTDKTSALYCEASIKHIQFPLIVDSGSAGSIISLSLLKDLDMEITKASKTVMINVNGERRRPLGAVTEIPLNIMGRIIPMDAIVTDANSYAAIVGNDWLKKAKATIDYETDELTLKWKGEVLQVPTECQDMPQHITTIEVPPIENEDEEEDEVDEDEEEEEEEEYETDDEAQDQLFCHSQFITKEKAQEIETELKDESPVAKDFYYQYKEIEKGKFHTGKLTPDQQEKFQEFMNNYQHLFAWDPNDFGKTSVVKHSIDTENATPIKQRFYRTSYQNQLFIKEEFRDY
jgi:hypothetical protein